MLRMNGTNGMCFISYGPVDLDVMARHFNIQQPLRVQVKNNMEVERLRAEAKILMGSKRIPSQKK
jgi:hypothetical protein